MIKTRGAPGVRRVVVLALASVVIAACGGDGTSETTIEGSETTAAPQATTTTAGTPETTQTTTAECSASDYGLRVVYLDRWDAIVESAAAALNGRYPDLEIETVGSPATNYDDLTQQIVADLAVDTSVDVIMAGLNQVRFWVDGYDAQVLDPEVLRDTFRTEYLAVSDVGGQSYLVPFQVSYPALMINHDLIREAGIDPATPPETIEDLIENVRTIADSGVDATPAGIMTNELVDWGVQALIQGAGGEFVIDGQPAFDTPEGRHGLSFYEAMGAEGLIPLNTYLELFERFGQGQQAYMVASSASITGAVGNIGDSFEWSVIPLPAYDGHDARYPAGGNGWMVLSEDPCRAAFANELVTELVAPEAIVESSRTFSYLPVDDRAAELLSEEDFAPQIEAVLAFEPVLTPWGGWPGTSTPEVNDVITQMVQSLLSGSAGVDEAVTNATEMIEGIVQNAG